MSIMIYNVWRKYQRNNNLPHQAIWLSWRLHPDYSVELAIQVDLFADNLRVTREIVLP